MHSLSPFFKQRICEGMCSYCTQRDLNANRRKQFSTNVIAFVAIVRCNISQKHTHMPRLPFTARYYTFVCALLCIDCTVRGIVRCCWNNTLSTHSNSQRKQRLRFPIWLCRWYCHRDKCEWIFNRVRLLFCLWMHDSFVDKTETEQHTRIHAHIVCNQQVQPRLGRTKKSSS